MLPPEEEMKAKLHKYQEAKKARLSGTDNVVEFRTKSDTADEGIPDELKAAIPTDSFTDDESSKPKEVLSADQELEEFVDSIDPREAYERWIGKEIVESGPGALTPPHLRISCPNPDHADRHPSASINLDTGFWSCHTEHCSVRGGDVKDLAAINLGMWPPPNRNGRNFNVLMRKIGEDYGWKIEKRNGMEVAISPARQAKEAEEAAKKVKAAEQRIIEQRAQLEQQEKGELPPGNVIDIETGEEFEDDDDLNLSDLELPSLDWRPLVKEGTFLDYYMNEVTKDRNPEEFHFWNGLMALALAAGNNVRFDGIKCNLFICHYGKTGLGKTKSMTPLLEILKSVMPFDELNPSSKGTFIIDGIQSGEGLVSDFAGEVAINGRQPIQVGNIKGLVIWDEMATILTNAQKGQGNIIKQKLNEFYDGKGEIGTRAASSKRKAVNSFACVSTSLQPENTQDGLTKGDVTSGFLNRFFFVTGTRKPQKAYGGHSYDLKYPIASLAKIHHDLDKMAYDNSKLEYVPIDLKFSETGLAVWEPFHDNIVDPTVANGSGALSRVNALIRKLVMLFSINAQEDQISEDSVNRAKMMWEYIIESYKVVDEKASMSATSQVAIDILDLARKAQMGAKGVKYITVKFIMNRKPNRYSIREINNALDDLCRANLLIKFPPDKQEKRRGRPLNCDGYIPTELVS